VRPLPVSFRSSSLFDLCSMRSSPRIHLLEFPNWIGEALDLDTLADRVIKPRFKANGLKWKG
jgi:hypothetical protein